MNATTMFGMIERLLPTPNLTFKPLIVLMNLT